jgi:hypothetical protein
MKKLLSFVALLLTVAVGVKAQTTLYSWESPDGAVVQTGGTITYVNGDGDRINYKNGNYYTICLNGKKDYINDATPSANAGHMEISLDEALQEGDEINITAYINKNSSSKASAYILIGSTGIDGTEYGDNANIGLSTPGVITTTTTKVPSAAAGNKMVKLSRSVASTNLFITKLTITRPDASAPTLSVDNKTLTLPLAPAVLSNSAKFKLTGENLTDGTYSLTTSNLAGLSVSPESFTVTDGKVEQEFTVTFTSENDVTLTSATITAAADGVSASVTVNCSAITTPYTPISVSEATTWDFTKLANTLDLSNMTPKHNTETILFANLNGLISFNENFPIELAQTISFEGQFPCRSGYAQNGALTFNITVPGTVEVEFSNTGGSNKDRYVLVTDADGDKKGKVEADGTTHRTESFDVAAGDITIKGIAGTEGGSNALRFFTIKFTPKAVEPATEPNVITVTDAITDGEFFYTTFSSNEALDFTGIEGITAYVGKKKSDFGEVNILALTPVEKVPANTGLFVKAEATGKYTIPFAEGSVDDVANDLLVASKDLDLFNAVTTSSYGDFVAGPVVLGKKTVGFYDWSTSEYDEKEIVAFFPATKPESTGTDILSAGTVYLPLDAATDSQDDCFLSSFYVELEYPAVAGGSVENIAALKAIEESSIVELTLTNAVVTQSKYDEDNLIDAIVIEDASGALRLTKQQLSTVLQVGQTLNGKITVTVNVIDLSSLGLGVDYSYTISDASITSIAYAAYGIPGDVTITDGTAEPKAITDETIYEWMYDYDWRYVSLANVSFTTQNEVGGNGVITIEDLGLDITVLDADLMITEWPADGSIVTVEGFLCDYIGSSVDYIFQPTKITVATPTTVAVTVGPDGYATFSCDKALDFTDSGIKAYRAVLDGKNITFSEVQQVPANTGVLLYAEGGATEDINIANGGTLGAMQNSLEASTADMGGTSLAGCYILSKVNGQIGFYKASSNATLAAGKAYFPAAAVDGARIILPGQEATSIRSIETAEKDAEIYNLQGQRVKKAAKGLNIINGRKVIIR